jgi:hypothetical protein
MKIMVCCSISYNLDLNVAPRDPPNHDLDGQGEEAIRIRTVRLDVFHQ